MKVSLTFSFILAASVGSTVGQTLFEAVGDATGNYSTLLGLVDETGAGDVIASVGGNITIFGPNNAAFEADNVIVSNFNNSQLKVILAGHVVNGTYNSSTVMAAGCVELETLAGYKIKVEYSGHNHSDSRGRTLQEGMVMVNGMHVVEPDIEFTGGIFHGIDGVILPGAYYTPCGSPGSGDSDESAASVVGASIIAMIASVVVAAAAFTL